MALGLTGCLSATPVARYEARTPAPVVEAPRPLVIARIVSQIPAGKEVGTRQIGLACANNAKVSWANVVESTSGAELIDGLTQELEKAGYRVIGRPTGVFEVAREPEFLLGASIKHVAMNVCLPFAGFNNFATSSGEAAVEVEWHLLDRRSGTVVLTAATGGSAKTERGPRGASLAYYRAFAASLRNLLADGRFAALVTRSGAPAEVAAMVATPLELSVIALDTTDLPAPGALLGYVQGAVATIIGKEGHGSAFIVSPGGLVLTAAHVVPDGAETVAVELPTAEKLTAKVVRINRDRDVALLRLPEGRYTAIPVGTVSSLRVGSPVFAIGTPLDARLARTVTKGVVSALRMDGARRFIQSDVAVHAGSSGGPLLDEHGRAVGITTSGISLVPGAGIGLNYFVPIDEAWSALNASPSPTSVHAGDLMVRPAQR